MAKIKNITSTTGSGMRDWLIQRVTAVLLTAYTLFLVGYLALHTPLQYASWQHLFQCTAVRIFTFLTLLGVVYHTWIGMWTVFTDYLKCPCLRVTLQVLTVLALLGCLVWGVIIVWGL
jgi:succinate dehydrogenase / fumarate reductase membrane anchor subunit